MLQINYHGELRHTKDDNHPDYSVWVGNQIVAQGGLHLTTRVFEERKKSMTVTPQVTIEQRVDQYIKLRNMIKEKDDAHKEAMAPYRDTLEKLNNLLLQHLNTIGAESVRSGSGTVYKTEKNTASLEDPDQFMRHVIGTESWELLARSCNKTAVEAFLEENGVLPPGVKFTSVQVVGVRKA